MTIYPTILVCGSVLTVFLYPVPVSSDHICLMVPPGMDECYKSYAGKPITHDAAQVACLQQLLWNFEAQPNNTEEVLTFFRDTFGPHPTDGFYDPSTALPLSGYRKRREYRTMSHEERTRFHKAMDRLYKGGVIRMFGLLLHQSTGHLKGPSFLPWNRVFITMFEEALRRMNPRVFLPYWDSTIDNAMDNPVNSILWTPKYFGTGTGRVETGLGAGYVTYQGHLERNIGMQSRLFSKEFIRGMLSQCYLKDISTPTAKPNYDFERMHGGTHIWTGADMAYPLTAAFDPLFYLHMAYIDYVWELFRVNQIRYCNVNPALDYPDVEIGSSHHPDSPIKGFDWLKNRDGIQNYWIDNWYQYETHPVCPDCCATCKSPKPMYCDTNKNVCVARSHRTNLFDSILFYKPHEQAALSHIGSPRNRGIPFHHPPGDGRTLFTAYSDTVAGKSNASEKIGQKLQGQSPVDSSFPAGF